MTGTDLRVRTSRTVTEKDLRRLSAAFGPAYAEGLWCADAESRRDSVCAALLLLSMLRARGIPPRRVARNPEGKPFFLGADGNRVPDCHFSLSHDRGVVCCALSGREIGADLMLLPPPLPPGRQEKMAARFLPPSDAGLPFDAAWTRMEAYSKLRGGRLADVFRCTYPENAEFETLTRRISGGRRVTVTLCRFRTRDGALQKDWKGDSV